MRGNRRFFTNAQWRRFAPVVATLTRRGPTKGDTRRFLEAVLWILRSGAPWRDLAARFGRWERIYRRYRRWAVAGRWERLHQAVVVRSDGERLLIDSTIIKAHPHAAGALKPTGGQVAEALGRSRGSFTTKLHAVITESGRLVRCLLTGGQVNDITPAMELVRVRNDTAVVADRAYDSNAFIQHIDELGMQAVIPSRKHRKEPRPLDPVVYRQRNLIERWFGRLKVFRRVATRYDKTARSFAGFIATAASLVAISGWSG
jgi:transposase